MVSTKQKTVQCVFLISMLPAIVCAHAPLKIQDFSAISTNDWSGQTNSKMLNNRTNKSFNHGTKNNPFTQKELINKFNQTVNIEYTTVNKYDTLGIRSHRLSFEHLPNWIKNAIPKKSEEEKRKFWQQAYIIIVQDDIKNGLEVYPISKNHFYQGYTQTSDIRTLEQSHPRLWSKIENY